MSIFDEARRYAARIMGKELRRHTSVTSIVNQAFLDGIEVLQSGRGETSDGRHFIFGIIRHRVCDAARKRGRHDAHVEARDISLQPSEDAGPLDQAAIREIIVAATDLLLAEKDELKREINVRHFFGGETARQIIEYKHIKGRISLSSIYVHIRETRERIKRAFPND